MRPIPWVLVLVLCGCASSLDLGKYKTAPMVDAPVKPQVSGDSDKLKVIVLDADDKGLPVARNADGAPALTSAIETMLGAGGVEVLDRKLAPRLAQELQLVEGAQGAQGVGYEGPAAASYAIAASITSADFGVVQAPLGLATLQVGAKGKSAPLVKATVDVSIKIYEVPSLRQLTVLNGSGSKTMAGDPRQLASSPLGVSMIRSAIADAALGARDALLNQLSAKGYVIEKRVGDGTIFKIMLGSRQGLHQGDTVRITTLHQGTNPLTGVASIEEELVVDASVTDHVGPTESWVAAKDEAGARGVHLGDVARKVSTTSLLEYGTRLIK